MIKSKDLQKGELKKLAQMLTKLRKTPVSEKVFAIVEEYYQNNEKRKQAQCPSKSQEGKGRED